MKPESKAARMLREGQILKVNTFDTQRGCYTIRIIFYQDGIYFHKMLNGCTVEAIRLDTRAKS